MSGEPVVRFEPLHRFYKVLFARIFLANQIPIRMPGANCVQDRELILQQIEDQIRRKLAEKRTWRKPVKGGLQKGLKTLLYLLSKTRYTTRLPTASNLDLGADEFGRNVATNVCAYARLLRNRGVKLHTVLVLGSRAKARWSPRSDVDLVVIADDLPDLVYERWYFVRDSPINMGADVFACSRDEFLRYLEEFRILTLDAICYGKIVFDDGFWPKVVARFEELEREYRLERSHIRRILAAV